MIYDLLSFLQGFSTLNLVLLGLSLVAMVFFMVEDKKRMNQSQQKMYSLP